MNIQYNEQIIDYITKIKQRNADNEKNGKISYAHVLTFGCQQNEADSEKIRGLLLQMGYRLTDVPENADILLLNTCAVREHAELKALSVVGGYKHIKTAKPDILIGVCGCMTAQEHRIDEIKHRYPYVDFTLEPSQIHRLPELIYRKLNGKRRIFLSCDDKEAYRAVEGFPIDRELSHRAWVSIMYGCNNFCSYCIVPYTRGRERSRASDDILNEVKDLIAKGYKDITLLGQNVNSYKSDCDFAELLERICKLDGDFLVRFMTSHPKDVPDKLIEVFAKEKKIAPHFHLPVQSGSDRILKLMNRHYDTSHYLSIVDKLRSANPNLSLTSDIIVGFPSETDEDFEKTVELVEKVRFDMIYTFIYSKRKFTPAAKMEEQIDESVKSKRLSRLSDVQESICIEKNKIYEDKTIKVLTDTMSRNQGILSGRTDTNKLVHYEGDESLIGKYVNVHIDRADAYAMYGKIVFDK